MGLRAMAKVSEKVKMMLKAHPEGVKEKDNVSSQPI